MGFTYIAFTTRCETELRPPFSDEVKNVWNFTSTTLHAFIVWYVINYEGNSDFNHRKKLWFVIKSIFYIIQIWVKCCSSVHVVS